MKFFALFAAVVAVAFANPAQWSIHELSTAIQNPATPAALVPVLEEALNELMLQAFLGNPEATTTVSTVVQDFSAWTLNELVEAIQDPATDPQLLIYLEHALNSMMVDIFAGNQPEYVIVATPAGLLPVEATIVPTPVESVVVPAPAESVVAPASSPLVQIIVNVKSQQASAPAPVEEVAPIEEITAINPIIPSPVVLPQPVLPEVVYPEPVVLPEPVLPEVVPSPVELPQPVLPEVIPVVPEPVELPQPVAPEIVNPIDVIAVSAPEVNPIDILAPVPVVTPVNAGDIVGPIV